MDKSEKRGTLTGIVLAIMVIVGCTCLELNVLLPTWVSLGLIAIGISILALGAIMVLRQQDK